MKRKLTAMLLVIVLVFVAAGCNGNVTTLENEGSWVVEDHTNIATLGDEYVPAVTYAYFFALYHQHMMHNATMQGHDLETFWDLDQDGIPLRQWLIDETMRAAIEYTGFYRLARAQGMGESDEAAEAAENQIANLLEQMEDDRDLFIRTYRITPEQMREVMRKVSIATHYIFAASDAIVVPEQALRDVFNANPEAFAEVTVRHVLIDTRGITDENERAEATALAESILERVNAGEPIGELAAYYSDDPGSRYSDGEYTFGRGVMVPEFEQWAFDAQPGDTGIVLTDFGYHIMQLMDAHTTFESVDMSEVEEQLRSEIFAEHHQDLLELMDSDDWVLNAELLGKFVATI